jgi:hypothetical protein
VNKHLAKYDQHGGVRVIVGPVNPAEAELSKAQRDRIEPYFWIDTCGHHQGQMLWRWVKPKCSEDALPGIACEVVKDVCSL